MMHELIDREDPRCLYCNSECDLIQDGQVILGPGSVNHIGQVWEVQILTCRNKKCHEVFEIHWFDNRGEIKMTHFVFTCKKITVMHRYDEDNFGIGGKELLCPGEHDFKFAKFFVPKFEVNFSDKKALHKKLKTYLTFS